MKRTAVILATSLAIGASVFIAPNASADRHFEDPYRDGPLHGRANWCEWTWGTEAEKVANDISEAVSDAFWAFAEFLGAEVPPDVEPEFVPEVVFPEGCDRAKAYDAERWRRARMLEQVGESALLWQNRGQPPTLDSERHAPDFVVVGMGDSFASGEGNPADGIDWTYEDDAWDEAGYPHVTWTTFSEAGVAESESDDPAAAAACHRSSKSGFASAMLELRRLYPQYNIFWRNFACSGAESRHLWKDEYVPWKFSQAQDVAGVAPEDWDGEAYRLVANSAARQPTQIAQARAWLQTFARGAPPVDATYMSVGGNDVFFGSVIAQCVHPLGVVGLIPPYVVREKCTSDDPWLDLARAAITGGVRTKPLGSPGEGTEAIDPLGGKQCTLQEIADDGCLSHGLGGRWSSSEQRYRRLDTELRASLNPTRIYLAEVPDFTRSDSGYFCGDTDWPQRYYLQTANEAMLTKRHDPYTRMHEDWLLQFSEEENWSFASRNVGDELVKVIRSVAGTRQVGQTTLPAGSLNWYLVSYGPNGDTLYEGWRAKHGMCALQPYVNTFEEAQDFQGEDMDDAIDVSAGALHPNAFGQQDYAERILWSMERQLVQKMTPRMRLLSGVLVIRDPVPGGITTLPGRPSSTIDLGLGWKDLEYPGGNERARIDLRVTPIQAQIKPVPLRVLEAGGGITYRLDLAKQEVVEVMGDSAIASTSAPGTDVILDPSDAGVLVEIRGCGPEAFEGDSRSCGQWTTAGSYVRAPGDLTDRKALLALSKAEPRLPFNTFRARLKTVLTKLDRARTTPILQDGRTFLVPFGVGRILGLTPASKAENAAPLPNLSRGEEPDWALDTPALNSYVDVEQVIACGVSEEVADRVLERLLRATIMGVSDLGAKLVDCIERGEITSQWPERPPAAETIMSICDATEADLEKLAAITPTDLGNDLTMQGLMRCLAGFDVPLFADEERLAPDLTACSLSSLDVPILNARAFPTEETKQAVNCLRQRQGLARLYSFWRDGERP